MTYSDKAYIDDLEYELNRRSLLEEHRMKHTEGPWCLFRPHRESYWHVNQQGGPGYIGDVLMVSHRAAECEANARLIAAAPDLLALAEWLLESYHSDAGMPEAKEIAREARAAIAKATGSTQ
jgi:hypothetical protein